MGVQIPLVAIARLITGHVHLAEVSAMQFDSRRADADGYLEFIWRTDVPRPEGVRPQAIALITSEVDLSTGEPCFYGVYGIHTVVGATVADCKAELFALIEAGQ